MLPCKKVPIVLSVMQCVLWSSVFSCLLDSRSVLFCSILCGSCVCCADSVWSLSQPNLHTAWRAFCTALSLSLSLSLSVLFSHDDLNLLQLDKCAVCGVCVLVSSCLTLNSCQFQTFIFLSSHSLCPHFLHLLVQVSSDRCGKNVY